MGTTDEYGLQIIGVNENWTLNGYKFSDADRRTIARLLKIGAETHHHTGLAAIAPDNDFTLDLAVVETGGSIPAGTPVFYRYTLVDEYGFQTAASAEYTVTTPAAVPDPSSPTLTKSTTGGTLLPGNYYYVLTAYTNVNTQETRAVTPAYITVPAGTTTNRIIVTYPTLPAGADGWNIYRKKPGGARYDYLASVSGVGPPVSYNDTGAVEEDCNRTIPARNLTNAQNTIVVTLADDTLDPGVTWKLYRSYNQNYENSVLTHVVEETFEGSGIITQVFQDTGTVTTAGVPPFGATSIGTPDKILLTDAAEVQGTVPLGMVGGFPTTATFWYEGTLAIATGEFVFPIMWPNATLIGAMATLGVGSTPNATPVIVDVQLIRGGGTPYTGTVYTNAPDRPTIPVGQQASTLAAPVITQLVYGDLLTVNIDQIGGGTNTDENLTVTLYLMARGFSASTSYTGGPTIP